MVSQCLVAAGWELHALFGVARQDNLAPFLALAGPVSDGMTTSMFRDYWGSLPWNKASFHAASPAALADLSAYPHLCRVCVSQEDAKISALPQSHACNEIRCWFSPRLRRGS